ncbi:FAD-dependent oxidoreductase [Adlercreutzia sp. ZJ138]|uniref:FAD-dependent oxidoreductase n=1 Tax=Adlercreutzia sp. ZJ138 TaxID=2709405 RepID=UPI0013EDA215|nr:FAD-dependent oxidoreductase [Adlercreutzia sp. ZJ138]
MTKEKLSSFDQRDKGGVSRREFLSGLALAGAGAATLGLAGCTPGAQSIDKQANVSVMEKAAGTTEASGQTYSTIPIVNTKNPTIGPIVEAVPANSPWAMPEFIDEPDEEMTCDLLCVGAGLGGMTAALTAMQNGVKNVIIVERADDVGGQSAQAEGITGIDTKWQHELGYSSEDINVDFILQQEYDHHHYICNSTLWRAVFKRNSTDLQWLIDTCGPDTIVGCGGGRYGLPTHHFYKHNRGHEMCNALADACREAGAQILLNTRAIHVLMDNGTLVGMQCLTSDGKCINIHIKAAVLATAGAGANKDLIERWSERNTDNQFWHGIPTVTGDGIMLAVEAGMGKPFRFGGPGFAAGIEPLMLESHLNIAAAMESRGVWLNQDGLRFYNEAANKQVYPPVNAVESQDRTFVVFDQNAMDYYKTKGVVNGWAQYAYPGEQLLNAEAECDEEIAKGNPYVFKTDSLEEMFEQMQLPVETAMETIEHYNAMVDTGEDTEFFKPKDYLEAVRRPPFYGARLKAMIISQKGGIHCNNKGEVTTRQGKSIPGLYVAGMDCGGFQSQTTGIKIPGSVQGYALGMGRISGENSAAYILGLEA